MPMQKVTNQQIIDAYRGTGSVWRAGKLLGIGGQSVHERLRAIGYKLAASKWTDEELVELDSLVDKMTIGEIADRLGRPYGGVAGMISAAGIGGRYGNRRGRPAKVPRGAGYDKVSVLKYVKALTASGQTVHAYARASGLGVENLCGALEKYAPEWWEAYRRAHSDLPEKVCPYDGRRFVPTNAKQEYCSRKCATAQRADKSYFGGNRRSAIGWAEGRCQVCGKTPEKGLTPHHMLGKENDPEDARLVAVCQGCHSLVTALGGRDFSKEAWESLVALAYLRRHGSEVAAGTLKGDLWTNVEIWWEEDVDDDPILDLYDTEQEATADEPVAQPRISCPRCRWPLIFNPNTTGPADAFYCTRCWMTTAKP